MQVKFSMDEPSKWNWLSVLLMQPLVEDGAEVCMHLNSLEMEMVAG